MSSWRWESTWNGCWFVFWSDRTCASFNLDRHVGKWSQFGSTLTVRYGSHGEHVLDLPNSAPLSRLPRGTLARGIRTDSQEPFSVVFDELVLEEKYSWLSMSQGDIPGWGYKQTSAKTLEECKDTCCDDAVCEAIKFSEESAEDPSKGCVLHEEKRNFEAGRPRFKNYVVHLLTRASRGELKSNFHQRNLPSCLEDQRTSRCLPNFLVVGVQKSGTSTLFELMRMHPQILPPRKKELHFFFTGFFVSRCDPPTERPTEEELSAYAENGAFPVRTEIEDASGITGEWSATYFPCWNCPAAMARLLPGVRLIVQLRDPILRAHSRYREIYEKYIAVYLRAGRDPPAHTDLFAMGFDLFCLAEMPHLYNECFKGFLPWNESLPCVARSNVIGWSIYHLFLKNWLHHFHAWDLLVTYLDDLATAPARVMRSIEAHLGLRQHTYGDELNNVYNAEGEWGWHRKAAARQIQVGWEGCEHSGIDYLVCGKLYDFFRPHMVELKIMADAGQINPMPLSWIDAWQLWQ